LIKLANHFIIVITLAVPSEGAALFNSVFISVSVATYPLTTNILIYFSVSGPKSVATLTMNQGGRQFVTKRIPLP